MGETLGRTEKRAELWLRLSWGWVRVGGIPQKLSFRARLPETKKRGFRPLTWTTKRKADSEASVIG
jgi:hypothetical protein